MKKKHSCAASVFLLMRVCIIQLALYLIIPSFSFAQTPGINSNLSISGMVRDEDSSKAIQGVSVTIKGSDRGTTTNSRGEFSITIPNKNSTLIFSSVDFGSQEIQVGNRLNFDVVLKRRENSLNEVVVIGYGTVKKKPI